MNTGFKKRKKEKKGLFGNEWLSSRERVAPNLALVIFAGGHICLLRASAATDLIVIDCLIEANCVEVQSDEGGEQSVFSQ